jgi:hypothetical protein
MKILDARLIEADGTQRKVRLSLQSDSPDDLQAAIRPWLGEQAEQAERVRILRHGTREEYVDMFVDADGAAHKLEYNPLATAYYWNNVLTHNPDNAEWPLILGPVLVFDVALSE